MKKFLFTFLFIILIISFIFPTNVFGDFWSEISSEVRPRPSTPISPPDPGPSPSVPTTPPTDVHIKQTIVFHTYISGNAFEDMKNMESQLAQDTGMPSTNGVKDSSENGIANIYVELLSGNNVVASQYTNANGDYRFDNLPDGDYQIRFSYGLLTSNINSYSNKQVKNILKYNGQDYYASSVGGQGTVLDSYTKEIITSGKGCTQLFLTIDNSASMVDNKYEGKTRLEYQVLAAKRLVNSLLSDSSNNIYIGIVAFGEESVVWQNLTKDKDTLNEKLDLMLNNAKTLNARFSGCTNIRGALEATEAAFVNNTQDSNRYIFLLSDGVPLSDGSTVIYSDDFNVSGAVQSKLDSIIKSTKQKFESLINDGVKVSTIMTKSNDSDVINMVNNMCNVNNLKFYHVDDKDVSNIISKDILDEINQSVQENIQDFSTYYSYFLGQDDSNRRNIVNSNFAKFDYNTSKLFEVIDNYDGSQESKNKAVELSDKSWMCAYTGVYNITQPNYTETDTEYIMNDGTVYPKEDYIFTVSGYPDQNLVLTQRDPFLLNTILKVSGLKITLSNGQSIVSKVDPEATCIDRDLEPGEIRYIKDVESPMCYYIDNEIVQGAVIQIEYTIIIKNASAIPSSSFYIIDYIPDEFSIDENMTMISDPTITNKMYGWEIKYTRDLGITDCDYTTCAVNNLSTNMIRNSTIGSNGERYLKIVFSRLLTSKTEDSTFRNSAEILEYSNALGRRMQETVTLGSGKLSTLTSVFVANQNESDFGVAEPVIIVPPTGISPFYKSAQFIIGVFTITTFIIIIKIKLKK